jgi:methionine sulfoxide reductase heme-binding subunit
VLGGRRATRVLKPLVFLACLVPFALLAQRALTGDLGTNPAETLEHTTGEWVLRFLAATLAVTPLRQLSGWNWLVKYRRMLGLFAFSYAIVHVSCYLVFDQFFNWSEIGKDIVKRKYITVGMLAFVSMIPLALTSTKGWIRRLGKRWGRLHRLVYLTAIAGTIHYLWAVKKDTFFPLVYFSIFAALLGFRAAKWIAHRRRSDRRGPGGSARPARAGQTDLAPARQTAPVGTE